MAYLSPVTSVTDSCYFFQHLNTHNGWNAVWDGYVYNVPHVGFERGTTVTIGAEVAISYAHAYTFNMYSNAERTNGSWGPWGAQEATFYPPGVAGTQLNGVSYQDSEWSWNTVQP